MKNEQGLLNKYNEVAAKKAEDYAQCVELLNEIFNELYEEHEDAQVAYDMLLKQFPFIEDYLCFEIIDWELIAGDLTLEEEVVSSFNGYYDTDCASIEEVIVELERYIHKAMCNSGCDQETAFISISEDVFLDGIICSHSGFRLCEL